MNTLTSADTLELLTLVKGFHDKQDLGAGTVAAWQMAFKLAKVTNLSDAKEAVVRHYSVPRANPWIIPGDVIGQYRDLRYARVAGINDGDLTPDVDPLAPDSVHIATDKARYAAVIEGMPREQAIATIPPTKMIEGRR